MNIYYYAPKFIKYKGKICIGIKSVLFFKLSSKNDQICVISMFDLGSSLLLNNGCYSLPPLKQVSS